MRITVITLCGAIALGSISRAEVIYDHGPGWGAPSGILGGYTMTPFEDDERPLLEDVLSVPAPFGGDLGFSTPMRHMEIGTGWHTWSHGYTGDVYFSRGQTSVTLSLPPDTSAFEFYVDPNGGGLVDFEAVTNDSISSGVFYVLELGRATYVGFYGTDGSTISSIEVTSSIDFAIGEFAIAVVPEPASPAWLALAAALLRRRR